MIQSSNVGTETAPSGLIVQGQPLDVKGSVGSLEVDGLQRIMYNDFLDAKELGKIPLDYSFDEWCRDSLNCLLTRRKKDIEEEFTLGKLSRAEREILEELRIKMIEAVTKMDNNGLDKYGVQYVDASARQFAFKKKGILTPLHRPDIIKSVNTTPKTIIA